MQSYPSPTAIATDNAGPFYSSASNQQHPVSSSDDLQLSAQLSRNLAPMMNTGSGGPLNEGQGPRPQDMANHIEQYDHERHGHMQQPNHEQLSQMAGQFDTSDGSLAPRKRSKVSRACDECRRKKIRCDATGEPGDEQCSSCKRVGTRCQFSRVPMKRGPSKGYIKELADRLNTLEGAINPVQNQYTGHVDNPMRRPSDEFSPPPHTSAEGGQRKRAYSSISGEFSTAYQPQRPSNTWDAQRPQDQSRQLQQPSSAYATPQSAPGPSHVFREPNYSPNGLAPNPQWRNPPNLHQQSSSFESAAQVEHSQSEPILELSDEILDGYYNTIHPTYPILSKSSSKLRTRVSNSPSSLKQAFCETLRSTIMSLSSSTHEDATQHGTKRAAQLIATFQSESASTRSTSANLLLLQTMMLMAIKAETYAIRGRSDPSRSIWLGSAVGLAYFQKLHLHKPSEELFESDPDSDEKLGRRVWWSLVIMDRWHASSTASPLLIPDGSVVVYPEDQALLGDALYQLARLSVVLGHFAEAALVPTNLPALTAPPTRLVSTLLRGELERWRESLPQALLTPSNSPLVHICYWHIRVLMELQLSESEPQELLASALHIVTQLANNVNLNSPLTYHSTALSALTLNELASHDTTREEAEKCLQTLLGTRIAPSAWDGVIREFINRKQSTATTNAPEGQHAQTAAQGLQRLADLATGINEDRESGAGETRKEAEKTKPVVQFQELRTAIRSGYLAHILGVESSG